MTKIMMTGASGRIGKELREYGVLPLSGDITDPFNLLDTVLQEKPEIIVHLASISDVEFCERPENTEKVIATNLTGTVNVLNVAEEVGAKVVLLSTDHVFGGGVNHSRRGPYKETDLPTPVNFYGMSKFAAEALQEAYSNLYVVRTSYLFDAKRLGFGDDAIQSHHPDFIYRSFMYLPHFISSFYMYLSSIEKMPKLLHITGSMTVSWYGFMKHLYGENIQPRKRRLEDFYAPRPYYAGLRTKYKLLPSYSFLEGIEQMKADVK